MIIIQYAVDFVVSIMASIISLKKCTQKRVIASQCHTHFFSFWGMNPIQLSLFLYHMYGIQLE